MATINDRGFYTLAFGPTGASARCKHCKFTAFRRREPGNGWQGRAGGEIHREIREHAEASHPEAMAAWHAKNSEKRRKQIAYRGKWLDDIRQWHTKSSN